MEDELLRGRRLTTLWFGWHFCMGRAGCFCFLSIIFAGCWRACRLFHFTLHKAFSQRTQYSKARGTVSTGHVCRIGDILRLLMTQRPRLTLTMIALPFPQLVHPIYYGLLHGASSHQPLRYSYNCRPPDQRRLASGGIIAFIFRPYPQQVHLR